MAKHLRSVRDRNGFLVDRELFDRAGTESVVGDEGVIHGVEFSLPPAGSQISDTVEIENMSVEGNFYLASLDAGLRFPLPEFMIGVLADYNIAPSQLAPNSWRILSTFYIGCRMTQVEPTSRVFRLFYRLKAKGGWYFFAGRGKKVVIGNPTSVKNWKGRFIRFHRAEGFGVSLIWRVADVTANTVIGVTAAERVAEQTIRETEQFHTKLLRDNTHYRNFWPRPRNLLEADVGPGDLGLPVGSGDELAGLSSESSSDDNAQVMRVPLAAVPLATLPSGESSRSQPAVIGGIC